MTDPGGPSPTFHERLHQVLRRESGGVAATRFAARTNVYNAGDRAEHVYFLESGRVKLVALSPLGKECLLAIHASGDVFGELSLGGAVVERLETATAMEESSVKALPAGAFMARLEREQLLPGFLQYLVARIAHQQHIITGLVTVDSEHRLGETLLRLARSLGQPDARSARIEPRLSHEELSQMVGTTRARVTTFMNRFRALGLIEVGPRQRLIVKEAQLAAHLRQPAVTVLGRVAP